MSFRPSASEERWLALARRLGRRSRDEPFASRAGGWRRVGALSRAAFFVMGLVAAAAIAAIAAELFRGGVWFVAGIASVITAEWLILGRRQFASGFEEALSFAGLSLIAFGIGEMYGYHASLTASLFGGAWLLAGARLLNPYLTVLAALALSVALDTSRPIAAAACYGLGLVALFLGAREFRRPSNDRLLDVLVIVMPLAGYFWSVPASSGWSEHDYRHARLLDWAVPLAPLAFAIIALGIGLRRRTHAPLIAAMLCIVCTAFELRALTGMPLERRLILWGALLLIAAVAVERWLRTPRQGITSRALRRERESTGLLRMAGAAVLTPHAAPAQATPSIQGAGGKFGGGGSSGSY